MGTPGNNLYGSYVQHGVAGSHFGARHGNEKQSRNGDRRFATAQSAVVSALSDTTVSVSSAMEARTSPAQVAVVRSNTFNNYGNYGAPSVHSRAPRRPPVRAPLGPGGGPPRYDPSNGGSKNGSHLQPQPRPLARQGGMAGHDYRDVRNAGQSPVSTVLGGVYHNYAVPPGSMPLGGGGDVHYMPRSISMSSRVDAPRERDGRGNHGRW